MLRVTLIALISLTTIFGSGCGAARAPIPPGEVPIEGPISAEDEAYGHTVLTELTKQYPLDTDDRRINRVRDIVDRLTAATGNDHNPWHVHVLRGDSVKNAAATRGNHVFVWTGLLQVVERDEDLATVLAHEIGHLLAGHTAADPYRETGNILAQIGGIAAGQATAITGYGFASDIAALVIQSALEAILVNPISREDELEADQIGLFVMAEAQYDPELNLAFWERVKLDPDFTGPELEFLSTHPSTEDRIEFIRALLPQAIEAYQRASASSKFSTAGRSGITPSKAPVKGSPGRIPRNDTSLSPSVPPLPSPPPDRVSGSVVALQNSGESAPWVVVEPKTDIHDAPNRNAPVVAALQKGDQVFVSRADERGWLIVHGQPSGYVRGADLAPAR
jgi:Zn-dependent protease with chaperone function